MGWLKTENDGAGLYFSDSGLDVCADFLQQFALHYQEELGRQPSLAELTYHLEQGLNQNLDDLVEDPIKAVSAISVKTKKRPAKPKAVLGDLLAIPLGGHRTIYGQVVEVLKRDDVVVEVLDCVSDGTPNLALAMQAKPLAQFRVEQTGVYWSHWKVIGNRSVPDGYPVKKVAYSLPCFVAEIEFVETLRDSSKLPKDYRLYADIGASHPDLREGELGSMVEVLTFLKKKKLLSKSGLAEFGSGELPADFALHSELLTDQGAAFYDKVFKKDYQSGYFATDTTQKIEQFWAENH
ncbi:immunity 26/phosphotriesterase HocA family protein [Stieleria sp. JC731]|uniref:immunity 26/phosphotriesterase HocA family protein n=1 Tax=Pirellulaceae TaxID=2691357 RepID=UPI001E6527DF|nr:immunity 26/phosphotriesterase HocA family protein [Stieleria sp. JC731]MCC9602687.1 immunity 26/phosphotriesterase HocA family protein [Stieleria sp. JC731]